MNQIWKYTFHPDTKSFDIPKGANIISVDNQHENICMWAEVDTDQPEETRYFEVIGTGHNYPAGFVTLEYIGSVQLSGGSLIFHIYENHDN